MRWNNNKRNNGWKIRFAWKPIEISGHWIWLERYIAKEWGDYTEIKFYEGCAHRVGYPCDCFRHSDDNLLKK